MSTASAPTTLAYLGPEGTFTEAATRTMPGVDHLTPVPHSSVATALAAVRSGAAHAAVVPFENSVEGSVNATLDNLLRGERLQIMSEVLVPVEFSLMTPAGVGLADITRIITHPVAEAQCRRWVAEHLPGVPVVMASSTAAAAAIVAGVDDGPSTVPSTDVAGSVDAAIAAPVAADHYGLPTLATSIGENADAVTRFVLVAQPGRPAPPTGADKTTFVTYLRADRPGALLELLEQCATRGVNLTRIHSRPVGDVDVGVGPYCFVLDAEGHIEDARLGEALMGLHRVSAQVTYFGSYPRADGVIPPVTDGTSNDDFHEAAQWLADLRRPPDD